MASLAPNRDQLTRNIDRIDSFLYWKTVPELHDSERREICPLCEGDGIFNVGARYMYCLCATKRWQRSVAESFRDLCSPYGDKKLEDIVVSRHPQVFRAVSYVQEWAGRPAGRLVITGGYGTGKSHMLQALAVYLSPIALYITAADFESIVFRGIGDNLLGKYMEAIRQAPVLLLDDLGMEYGSPIVVTQLDGIIDFRWRFPEDFPMAVATNYSGNELQTKGRYGSRLMDRENLIYAGMPDVEDYRLRKR